ncbi:MAG: protein kinase domain-containing protein [Syntrophobacteraceae bacterium]
MFDLNDLIGRQIDQFRLDQFIARGPMGLVMKAFDTVLIRTVALKLIPKRMEAILSPVEAVAMETAHRRLVQEATAAGRLSHPNIVTIHSYGETNEFEFICMEYVSGQTLAQILQTERTLRLEAAVSIFEQVLMALEAAHTEQIIHRDIKPSNIMITDDKRVKVMDFGIAKLPSLSETMAMTRTVLGTPYYMSPEQISGQKIDIRSDIFSLGAVLYESLTGEKPFSGENTATLAYKIVQTDPVPPRVLNLHIPPALGSIITKALAKDPAQRFQTPDKMLQELKLFIAGDAYQAQTSVEAAVSGKREPTVHTPPVQEDAFPEASSGRPAGGGSGPEAFLSGNLLPAASCGIQEQTVGATTFDGQGSERTESFCPGSVVEDNISERPSEAPHPRFQSEWGLKMLSGYLLSLKKLVLAFPKHTTAVVIGIFLCIFSVALTKKTPENPAPAPLPLVVGESNRQAEPVLGNEASPKDESLASAGQSPPAAVQPVPVSGQDEASAEKLIAEAKLQFGTDPANAEKLLNEAISLEPENFEGYLQLGRLLTFRKDYSGAIQQYQRALRINDQIPEIHFNLGYIYMNQGVYDRARESYYHCLDSSPSFKDEVLTNLGIIEMKAGNETKARELFMEALKFNAGNKLARKYIVKLGERDTRK